MPYAVRKLSVLLLLGILTVGAPPLTFAQTAQDKGANAPQIEAPSPERIQLARDIVEETLKLARAEDIYNDLRRTLKDVYIPVLKEATEGGYPGVPAPDPARAAAMAKTLTFLTYVQKAGDEIDGAIRDEISAAISDAAILVASHATAEELADTRRLLAEPATRKVFEIFYAASQFTTSFNYEETRTLAEYQALISSWADTLDVDPSQFIPGLPGGGASPSLPSSRKIEKAQALIADMIKITRLDDMVSDAKRFARDVYSKLAAKSPQEREDLISQIDQMEYVYTMRKSLALAMGPLITAGILTDEQLATLHTFVRTPVFAKVFQLMHTVVQKSASFTTDEIQSTQTLLKDIEQKSGGPRSVEQQKRIDDEWAAFAEKWQARLLDRLTPETRAGLEASYRALRTDYID